MQRTTPVHPASLLVLLLLLCASCAPAGRSGAVSGFASPESGMQLFLLAGQSNMAGRGYIEAEDTVPHERVWMLDRAEAWVPAVDPVLAGSNVDRFGAPG